MNTWSLVGGIVWEGSGSVGLLEMVCVLGYLPPAYVSKQTNTVGKDASSRITACLPAASLLAVIVMDSSSLEPWTPN